MVKINSVVTKTGDDGSTSLFGNGRVRKDSVRMDAIGSVDELIAILGMLRSQMELTHIPQAAEGLAQIQNDLFDLGSELAAAPCVKSPCPLKNSQILYLEKLCSSINSTLPELTSFVLPGGSIINSWFHIARVTARKAERAVVKFSGESAINPLLQVYLNRLSDLLFIFARASSLHQNISEILWKPGGVTSNQNDGN